MPLRPGVLISTRDLAATSLSNRPIFGFISTSTSTPRYTGDSALLPALWKFLGAPPARRGHLQAARDAAPRAMPRPHADFLDALTPATAARPWAIDASASLPVAAVAAVEAEFNGCLDEVARYCSRRSQLVCRYLPAFAAEFRAHEFDHDRRALLAARLSVVQTRRRGRARAPAADRLV